jgi:hypothetical protein
VEHITGSDLDPLELLAARACLLTGAFAALAWSLVDRSDDRAAARASADVISASRL